MENPKEKELIDLEKKYEDLKKEIETIESQRADSTKNYADKVRDLQVQKNDLEAKCNDLQNTINQSVVKKQNELNSLAEDLRNKLSQADTIRNQHQSLLREANDKVLSANKMLSEVVDNKSTHDKDIAMQVDAINKQKEDIANRDNASIERAKEADKIMLSAHEAVTKALDKENSIRSMIEESNALKESVAKEIENQKNIEDRNNKLLCEATLKFKEAIELKEKIDIQTKINRDNEEQLNKYRDSLDQRKEELTKKEYELKQIAIKNIADGERLKIRQKDIDFNIGKLNELKNSVDILMEKREVEI